MSIQANMKHTITHWPVTGSNGYGGFVYGTPAIISGRWEEAQKQFVNPEGEEVTSMAVAYLGTGGAAVQVGDYLIDGDNTATADPNDVTGEVMRVRQLSRITDLSNVTVLHKLFM